MSDGPLDLDDFYADRDRRARERADRRLQKRRPRREREPLLQRVPLPEELRHIAAYPSGRVLIATVAAIAGLTVIGLIALWPGAVHHDGPSQAFGGPTQTARVTRVSEPACPTPAPQRCRQIFVDVAGADQRITLGPVSTVPDIHTGQNVRVSKTELPAGAKTPAAIEAYQFVDVDRQGALWQLVIGIAVLALLVLFWRGLLAVVGVALSLGLLVWFVVPGILSGEPALLVALVGALAVMFVTLVLTNGLGAQTLAAALGIATTLVFTALLAALWIHVAHLDGRSDDTALYLTQQNSSLSLQGVVLAGMIIGALGVLADTAVTQASAVMALRRADPLLSSAGLYRGAFSVGRDHLSATIHTLVLAYAGSSLPLLLAMRASGLHAGDAINSGSIAEPIVATGIGIAALIAAVPLTTGLASVLVARLPSDALADGHAGHHH
jgi:uncharacterized membrane protein